MLKKITIGIALACGLCCSQAVNKLSGKRIFLHRKDGGDHSDGFVGLKTMLEAKKAAYGYILESSTGSPAETDLNNLFNRLKGSANPGPNPIDILIFCQGQGDQNVGGGSSTTPFANASDRFTKVNNHVKNGGGLIMVHAAAGREVSWQNWWFGAKLMTDWFLDSYSGSAAFPGNGGHYSYPTNGTYTLDEETVVGHDPSTFFIRNILTAAKTVTGFAQPLVSPTVGGEWYHFNAGKKYEDGLGGAVSNANNKIAPAAVRGNPGVPDSGIGPAKVVGGLTKIETYIPPGGKGRPGVWAREVSKGVFNAAASKDNGRFLYFNPGHAGEEYTLANGWMGDFFLACLRWTAKEDRGCTATGDAKFNPTATVLEQSDCSTVGVSRDGQLLGQGFARIGNVAVKGSSLEIALDAAGPHSVQVLTVNGERVFQQRGTGANTYVTPNLERGFYVVFVNAGGKSFRKMLPVQL